MSSLFVLHYFVVFCIGWVLTVDFEIGDVVIAWNLKWKTDGPITHAGRAAKSLAHSWVEIVDRNASRGERHEYTIQSLMNDSIKLMVPKKKITNFTKIKVHDFTNSTFDLMIRKRDELKQNSSNHVLVLPFHTDSDMSVPKVFQAITNPLFALKHTFVPLHEIRLRDALLYINKYVPTKARDLLYYVLKRWVEKHETPSDIGYFGRIWATWRMNISMAALWKDFSVDPHRNAQFLQTVLENIRNIQRNPSYGMSDTDWLLPAKQMIADKILGYWLKVVNDPKQSKRPEYLHVLWKWNDVKDQNPGFGFIDMNARDAFPVDRNGEVFIMYKGKYALRGKTLCARIRFINYT